MSFCPRALAPSLLSLSLLLAGCAASPPVPPPPPPATAAPVYKAFAPATLEALLTAELAAYRQRPDLLLGHYASQAELTRDPGVVARATTIAQVLNRPERLQLAQLWTEVSPHAADAWYLYTLSSLQLQRFELALPALEQLLALQPEADLEQLFLAAIPAHPQARADLLTRLQQLQKTHPDNAYLLFGQALLQAQNGQTKAALQLAEQARLRRPEATAITLLTAKLLTEQGRSPDAVQLLQQALRRQPGNASLRLNLARAQLRAGDSRAAQREFQTLLQQQPQNQALRLSLALVALDNHDDASARRELLALQDDPDHADEAHYYLGLLALRQQQADAALAQFELVQPGLQYLPALAETSRLLQAQGQAEAARARLARARQDNPELAAALYQLEAELLLENAQAEAAWQLLNQALQQQPDNASLRLSRALAAERLDRLDAFEADMREVLRQQPDNAAALNALGYTLADRTNRLQEAEAYIRRALSLKPDDPAIIDSLGWVKFKQGDTPGALSDLRRAYALFPDDEVAAHLGEVLWVSGHKAEARRIWREALQQHPKSLHIPSTQQRLDPP